MDINNFSGPIVAGEVIRDVRKRLGKAQNDLAKEAGVAQSVISRLENGKPPYNCDLSTILAIANCLEIPITRLLSYSDNDEVSYANPRLEDAFRSVVEQVSQYDQMTQRQAAFILEGYIMSLVFENNPDNQFGNLDPNSPAGAYE